MIKANNRMKKLLSQTKSLKENSILQFNIRNLNKLLLPIFVQVHSCIIISDKPVVLSEEQFEKVISMYGDKTGYEASNTETRINDYIEGEDTMILETLSLALLIMEVWSNKLKVLDNQAKFCFIFSCFENYVTFRFHKIRDNEIWVSENLEGYGDPIGYMII